MFPAVKVCNLNLVNYDYVITDPNLFQIVEELSTVELLKVNLSEFSPDPVSDTPIYTVIVSLSFDGK